MAYFLIYPQKVNLFSKCRILFLDFKTTQVWQSYLHNFENKEDLGFGEIKSIRVCPAQATINFKVPEDYSITKTLEVKSMVPLPSNWLDGIPIYLGKGDPDLGRIQKVLLK